MKKNTTPKKISNRSGQSRPIAQSKTATKAKRVVSSLSKSTRTGRVTDTKPALPRTPHEAFAFWVNDGSILHDLRELAQALTTMETAVFAYHVQTGKNDFADWVEQVLNDVACAAALRTATTKRRAANVVTKHLTFYV